MPSVLWHCSLGVDKSIQPVKTSDRMMRCWRGYLSGVRCKWFACGPADAIAIPSYLVSLTFGLVQPFWCQFTQAVPEKEAIKRVSVFPGKPKLVAFPSNLFLTNTSRRTDKNFPHCRQHHPIGSFWRIIPSPPSLYNVGFNLIIFTFHISTHHLSRPF